MLQNSLLHKSQYASGLKILNGGTFDLDMPSPVAYDAADGTPISGNCDRYPDADSIAAASGGNGNGKPAKESQSSGLDVPLLTDR